MESQSLLHGDWETSIFGCFENIVQCLAVAFCPCFVDGCIYMKVIDNNPQKGWLVCCLSFLQGHLLFRWWYADKEGFTQDPWRDFLISCCCVQCAMCQEYRWMSKKYFSAVKISPMLIYRETLGRRGIVPEL